VERVQILSHVCLVVGRSPLRCNGSAYSNHIQESFGVGGAHARIHRHGGHRVIAINARTHGMCIGDTSPIALISVRLLAVELFPAPIPIIMALLLVTFMPVFGP